MKGQVTQRARFGTIILNLPGDFRKVLHDPVEDCRVPGQVDMAEKVRTRVLA